MNDRPTAQELIEAVGKYLETELLPSLTDARLRFQTLVAANVLAIVGRELTSDEAHLREEWDLLGQTGTVPVRLPELREAIREANLRLCEQIRAGQFDERASFQALAQRLRTIVVRKLAVANPRYLAHG